LEWEEVYRDNFYGTLKERKLNLWAGKKYFDFYIDVSGGCIKHKLKRL
jgi:guanylate kinase